MDAGQQTTDTTPLADLEFVGTLTAKGGVTIPVEVRRFLQVKPKEKVVFRIRGEVVEIKPGPMTLEDAMASVKPLQPDKSLKQVRDEALEEHVQRVAANLKP